MDKEIIETVLSEILEEMQQSNRLLKEYNQSSIEPDQNDPLQALSYKSLHLFYNYQPRIFYQGVNTNGTKGTKLPVFPP